MYHLTMPVPECKSYFFFFNDTATTEIYTLSLHDALPILSGSLRANVVAGQSVSVSDPTVLKWFNTAAFCAPSAPCVNPNGSNLDRKSTRLNSSHLVISYAVFCLKKNKNNTLITLH